MGIIGALDTFFFEARDLTLLSTFLRLAIAAILGGLVGMERGRHGRAAGMRTHILVCLGASLTALVGIYTARILGYSTDPLRVGAQVISGIGFLGAGTILIKDRFQVTGLTTAAGLWATAAVGLSIGIGFYAGGITATIFVLLANKFLPCFERYISHASTGGHLYVEVESSKICEVIEKISNQYQMDNLQVIPAKSGTTGIIGLEFEIFGVHRNELAQICQKLMENSGVSFAIETI